MYVYAAWYQYNPKRVSNGLAIWRGNSLVEPEFELIDTLRMPTIYTVDKMHNCDYLIIFCTCQCPGNMMYGILICLSIKINCIWCQ